MADLATAPGALPDGKSLLDKQDEEILRMDQWRIVLMALLGGLGYIGVHISEDLNNVIVTSIWPYVAAGRRAADRAWVRVCEWLPRHGQRGGDGDLYALAGAQHCGGLVGVVQPGWRAGFERRGGFQRDYAAACRADSSGQFRAPGSRWCLRC